MSIQGEDYLLVFFKRVTSHCDKSVSFVSLFEIIPMLDLPRTRTWLMA